MIVDDKIESEEFRLTDDNDVIRARLGLVDENPELAFFDETGKVKQIVVGICDEGPQVVLSDAGGIARIRLYVLENGQMGLSLLDPRQNARAEIRYTENNVELCVRDQENVRILLNVSSQGAQLQLSDKDGKKRAHLDADDKQGRFVVLDGDGNEVVHLLD